MSQVGVRIRQIRTQRGETQEAVARRAGVTNTTFVRVENGHNEPTLKSLIRIAEALEVSLDDLAGDDTEPVAS